MAGSIAGGFPRVTLLGFDAGSPALVRDWVAAGHLPNFALLFAIGATAPVHHEPGLYVGSIWPTAATGVGVGRHGFYTGIRPAPRAYHYVAADVAATPFWVSVGRAGRRISVVDVPFFRAVDGLDGNQLVEWGCHDRYHGTHSSPPGLLDDVLRDVGRHSIGMLDHPLGYERFAPCDWVHRGDTKRSPDELDRFVSTLTESIGLRQKLSKYMLSRGPYDLVVDIVAETHCAGHHLWHLHDCSHPDHDAEQVARLGGDPLLHAYRQMDDLLGIHVDALGPDGVGFVFLSHGMRAHFDGTHLLDELLWRLERTYLESAGPAAESLRQRTAARVHLRVGRLHPRVAGATGSRLARSAPATPAAGSAPPPAAYRLWFPIDNNTVAGAARFNQVGREPQGLIDPGATGRAARWLERELRSLVNLDTGGPVVTAVYPTSRLYARDPDDGLPDLIIEWCRDHPIERVWSPRIGTVLGSYPGHRTGDHDAVGELIAFGPGVRAGRNRAIRTVDVAPTVAAAAGVALADRDGRPVDGLLPGAASRLAEGRRGSRWDATKLRGVRNAGADRSPATQRELVQIRQRLYGLERAHHETRQMADAAQATATLLSDVLATTSWIRSQPVSEDLSFTVVTPTRGRRVLLQRAVASVLAQTYAHVELIVIDDASNDGTADWLASVVDARVRVIRNESRCGEGSSRNAALEVATGDLITFLDDDNSFEPDWLRSLAWLFAEQPEAQVAYGARLVDDAQRHRGQPGPGMPTVELNEWSRTLITERNLVDMNVLAHRSGGARFDPELPIFTDWDYLRQLVAEHDPVRLPVLAARYTTSAPDRATDRLRDRQREHYDLVRGRWVAPCDAS